MFVYIATYSNGYMCVPIYAWANIGLQSPVAAVYCNATHPWNSGDTCFESKCSILSGFIGCWSLDLDWVSNYPCHLPEPTQCHCIILENIFETYQKKSIQNVHICNIFFIHIRGDRLPKYGCFFEKSPNGLDPPPLSLFGNYIALFSRKFFQKKVCINLQWNFLDWRWPPPSPPLFGQFFQNLRLKYTSLKPNKSAM